MTSKSKANLNVSFSDVVSKEPVEIEQQSLRRLSNMSTVRRVSVSSTPRVRSWRRKSSVFNGRRGYNSGPSSLPIVDAEQQLNNVGRNHFLQSFGKDTLYRYEGVEKGVFPQKTEEITEKQRQNLMAFILRKDSSQQNPLEKRKEEKRIDANSERFKRTASAGTVRRKIKTEWIYEDILEIRGKNFSTDSYLDIKEKLRTQSARRRIRRIMQAGNKEKTGTQDKPAVGKKSKETQHAEKETMKGATVGIFAKKHTTQTFDLVFEKKKWLSERRKNLGLIALEKFRWAARVVCILCKVLRIISSFSSILTAETAAQRSWYALKHSTEANEILFNMTVYQKGKSNYAYIPEWVKNILSKSPMERTDVDLRQLHSLLTGLQSYDKFTNRIQMAMCRAMIYQKVENRRVILRKGHEGMAFYFIFSGSVFVNVEQLLKNSGHVVWHTAVVLSRGDSFGELALLRKIKRTASVVVREDVELLVVDRDVFAITCPKIYDKELADKVRFCKGLDIFRSWTDEVLRNLCFEAQIQEWKSNKVIVKDSSKETEWIYICVQGRCSVVKPLDLTVPPGTAGSRTITFYEPCLSRLGKKGLLAHYRSPDVWKKDLEKGLKENFIFAHQDNEVDKIHDSESESLESDMNSEDKPETPLTSCESAKERIIETLSYSSLPQAKGDSKYFEVGNEKTGDEINRQSIQKDDPKYNVRIKEEQPPRVLEKKAEVNSFTLLDLMGTKHATRTLNKDVVYLIIASVQSRDIFDLSEILMPTGRQLMLVSKGAVILRIKRADFLRYSNQSTLKHAREIAMDKDYPSDEILYRSYSDYCAWESYKRNQVNSTMKDVQDACIRHNQVLHLANYYIREPPKISKEIQRMETEKQRSLEEFDNNLNFVYSASKVFEKCKIKNKENQ